MKTKLRKEIKEILSNYGLYHDTMADELEALIAEEVKEGQIEVLDEVERLIWFGTDGVHLVMVARINKEKFDVLKKSLETEEK